MNTIISMDNLLEIVRTGGKIQTGVDVYNDKAIRLLDAVTVRHNFYN